MDDDDMMAWARAENLKAHEWRQMSFPEKVKKVGITPENFEEHFKLCMIFFECLPDHMPGIHGFFGMNIPNLTPDRKDSYYGDGIFEARNPFTGKSVSYLSNDENDQKIYNFSHLMSAFDTHQDDSEALKQFCARFNVYIGHSGEMALDLLKSKDLSKKDKYLDVVEGYNDSMSFFIDEYKNLFATF
jgi:hypothetical protein